MKDISEATNPALRGSLAALRRAAEEARRIAFQTGTDLIVFRNGEITRIPPQALAEPATPAVPANAPAASPDQHHPACSPACAAAVDPE